MYEDLFYKRLAELRANKGVSARDMSLSIGQSAGYINALENRNGFPSMLPVFYDSTQEATFVRRGLSEQELFVGMAQETAAAIFDFKHNESRDSSNFKSYCVAYMTASRYGVDTRGFDFSRLPGEYAQMETQDFKAELGGMRDVMGEIQTEMYKSLEKNKPAREKEQAR